MQLYTRSWLCVDASKTYSDVKRSIVLTEGASRLKGSYITDTLACMLQQAAPKAAGQGLAGRVKSQLTGVKTVLVSAPGVLLEEWSPEQLQVQQPPA